MTAHFSNGPVTLFKFMLHTASGAAGNGVFQQRVIRHDGQAIVLTLYFTDKAGQERLNQLFRLRRFAIFFSVDDGDDTVAMHHFFHLRRWNEITFLRIDFQEAKAFFRGFYHPFSTWRLGM